MARARAFGEFHAARGGNSSVFECRTGLLFFDGLGYCESFEYWVVRKMATAVFFFLFTIIFARVFAEMPAYSCDWNCIVSSFDRVILFLILLDLLL